VPSVKERFYPEVGFGGFSDIDGTVVFYSRVHALLTHADVVLDVGCGRGRHLSDAVAFRKGLRVFRGKVSRVIGIDVDPEAKVNPFVDEFRLISPDGKWPIATESINCVIADFVIEHLEDPAAFFSEASRVLCSGGVLCARTPNRNGYVALIARAVPERFHHRILSGAQRDRQAKDIFPAFYKCNVQGTLLQYLHNSKLSGVVYGYEAEPSYFEFSSLLYGIARWVHLLTPPFLRSTLFVYARKK